MKVVVAAGDIAACHSDDDEATARLPSNIRGTVLTLGDNAYEDGTPEEFAECYDPSWGRYKARTKPTPGNHEYHTQGAEGYFDYFGDAAGDPDEGYYSYDLGAAGTWSPSTATAKKSVAAAMPRPKFAGLRMISSPTTRRRARLSTSTTHCSPRGITVPASPR